MGFFCYTRYVYFIYFLRTVYTRHNLPKCVSPFEYLVVPVAAGFVGSKLHSLIDKGLWTLPNGFADIRNSGMFWQGGMVLGVIVFLTFVKFTTTEPLARISDISMPTIPLGYGVGKLGCFFSGDGCYGQPTSLPWGMSFPNARIPTRQFVHPVPLYEFKLAWICAWILWKRSEQWTPATYRPWDNTLWTFILVSITRFFIEFVRDHRLVVGGLLTSFQMNCLLSIIGSLLIRMYLAKFVCIRSFDSKKSN
jgi:phosphatidylglycerol:prolipoprotein diacylglycerol transferase